jgi:hypothetical protein
MWLFEFVIGDVTIPTQVIKYNQNVIVGKPKLTNEITGRSDWPFSLL